MPQQIKLLLNAHAAFTLLLLQQLSCLAQTHGAPQAVQSSSSNYQHATPPSSTASHASVLHFGSQSTGRSAPTSKPHAPIKIRSSSSGSNSASSIRQSAASGSAASSNSRSNFGCSSSHSSANPGNFSSSGHGTNAG
jgi:hypothetical protein